MVPGSPCIRRATRQEGSLPVSCASVFLSLRPFGEVTHPFPGGGLHRPVSLLLQILLASREQMGYLPLRAARCAMPESPVEPRSCGACRTGDSCRSCSGAALFFTHGATIRCPILRIQAGMPRQDWRRHDSGTPWKERIFRP